MMKRSWIWIQIFLVLMVSACQGDAAAPKQDQPDTEVVVATFTATPFVDMAGLAARTHTATVTPTATQTATALPSATATQLEMTATQTSAAALQTELTATQQTMAEGADSSPTPSPEVTGETLVSVNTEIPEGRRYFTIQEGAPVGMPNWANQEVGCAWLGVAGQVFDLQGEPVLDLIVEAGGTLEGQPLLGLSITGMASAYGPGGYEIQFSDHVVASQSEAWVQIKTNTGEPLSGRTFIETFDDCAQNLLLLNFVEVEEIPDPNQVFLPLIIHQDSD